MKSRAWCRLLPVGLAFSNSAHAGDAAQFTPLGDLPGGAFHSEANGISADGAVIVGRSRSAFAANGFEPFRWTASDGMIGMGRMHGTGEFFGSALAASADGSVIVGNAPDAFRWTAATGLVALNDLSTTGFSISTPMGVSADGSVVVGLGAQFPNPQGAQAFRWTAETGAIGLGALSSIVFDSFASGVSADGSVAVGQSMSGPPDVEAIHWTAATGMTGLGALTVLSLGFSYALGWGISADGATLVGQARTDDFEEAFLWRQETGMVSLDPLRGTTFFSIARDASADGAIIVGYGEHGAMIWDIAHGMRSVQSILADDFSLDLTGWQLWSISAVSDDGTRMAGVGLNPQGQTEAWTATIPPYCTRFCGDLDGSARTPGEVPTIDHADVNAFVACLEGVSTDPQACLCADFNEDEKINLSDWATMTRLFGTESTNPVPNCSD